MAGVFKKSENFHSIKIAVSKCPQFQNGHIKTTTSKNQVPTMEPKVELPGGGGGAVDPRPPGFCFLLSHAPAKHTGTDTASTGRMQGITN